MKIFELTKEVEQYVIDMRRHFHENPELSGKEEKTIARISQELDGIGIDHVVVPNGGIIATIEGAKPGKTVMLRADVDALPVQETPNNLAGPRTCCSKIDGAMHACGHDGHTAMLLGMAKILKAHTDEINGRVILLFERGEEGTGNITYLLAYLDENNIKIDTVYGSHLYAMLETGKVGIITGGTMAAAMAFNVTIKGKGGHGSRPDQSNSPIDCFVAIYNALQAARLAKINPYEPLTYSVGTLNSGTVANVIPETLTFSGTARSFNREIAGLPFREEFLRIVENISKAYGCEAIIDRITGPNYSVFNDAESAELARNAIAKELGADAVCQPEPWMASESFSTIQKMYSGVFAFVGVKNDAKGIGAAHHNPYFDLDEDAFKYGMTGALAYTFEFLNSDLDTSEKQFKGGYKALMKDTGKTDEEIKAIYDSIK